MPFVADENASPLSARAATKSPAVKRIMREEGVGTFGRLLLGAKHEVNTEVGAKLASQCARRERQEWEEHKAARAAEDAKGLEAAQRLDLELKDEALALELERRERAERERAMAKEAEDTKRDEDMARELAKQLQAEEDRLREAEEKSGEEAAREWLDQQRGTLVEEAKALGKQWGKAQLHTEDVDGGIHMSFHLPRLEQASVVTEIRNRVIHVSAESELHALCQLAGLPTKGQRFTAELEIVSDDSKLSLADEDVAHTYHREEGTLTIFLSRVWLRKTAAAAGADGRRPSMFGRLRARMGSFRRSSSSSSSMDEKALDE